RCKTFCKRWGVPRYDLDYREMIRREKPDIVSVGTPTGSHAEVSIFAMRHGVRGVYCEKAMCSSLEEADAIGEAVHHSGAKFMLGAQRRHHPNLQTARRIAASGELGRLVSVTTWMECALLHSLSHLIDAGLYLAGDAAPIWVFGLLGSVRSHDVV